MPSPHTVSAQPDYQPAPPPAPSQPSTQAQTQSAQAAAALLLGGVAVIPGPETTSALGYRVSAGARVSQAVPPAGKGYRLNYYNQQQQVGSRAATTTTSSSQSPSHFLAAQLPRTSSLLPPPNLIIQNQTVVGPQRTKYPPVVFQNPFNAQPIPPESRQPQSSYSPPNNNDKRRPSRSSSVGGLSDGFRNLNRWSTSTSSSRASISFAARRQSSIDAVAFQSQGNPAGPAAYQSPPRKLQKSRPSNSSNPSASALSNSPSNSASRVRRQSTTSTAPVPPLESLPPIIALPSLEQEVSSASAPTAGTTARKRAPSAADDSPYYRNDNAVTTDDISALPAQTVSERERRPPSHARSASDATMMYERNGEVPRSRGHSRNRSQAAMGSTDTTASTRSRERSSKQPSQKAMLSRALQKANTAVQLDNARNFEGARQAYSEACELLYQVLVRTSGEEDRRKLEAISKTYTSRIEDLDEILPMHMRGGKALPSRPRRDGREDSSLYSPGEESGDDAVVQASFSPRKHNAQQERKRDTQSIPSYSVPTSANNKRQVSAPSPSPAMMTTTATTTIVTPNISVAAPERFGSTASNPSDRANENSLQSTFSRSPKRDRNINDLYLQRPMDAQYMPAPLSPRRPSSPGKPARRTSSPDAPVRVDFSLPANRLTAPDGSTFHRGHSRGNSHESVSWLDPIDESGGSDPSSAGHSRNSSSVGMRRKRIRAASGDTETEFDAALDDAIEAAYDDGYDVVDTTEVHHYPEDGEEVVARALRRVELAKERVRESEREALELANERERRLREQLASEDQQEIEGFYDGNDSEEEERLLEVTKGYATEEFPFNPRTRPSVPVRASDSSELTSRTWHTSMGSNPATATTVLSTVSESKALPGIPKPTAPLLPPPTQALPQLPPPRPGSSATHNAAPSNYANSVNTNTNGQQGVRSRRLSGQNLRQLKIETTQLSPPKLTGTAQQPVTAGAVYPSNTPQAPAQPPLPKTAGFIVQQRQALAAGPRSASLKQTPTPSPLLPPTPPLPQGISTTQDTETRSASPSTTTKPTLRKNFSSSSLKSLKSRNLSVSNIEDASDMSPATPLSTHFGTSARTPAVPSLPTPTAAAYKDKVNSSSTGGLHLFDNEFHSPNRPGSPNLMHADAPVHLEPCPTDHMLRPFWLMRCLFQTLAHPRGGYISNRLFVPRDAWRVKGVKLKNVEDKIANCDFLTAALQKLSRVDTCDADAVLDEMQQLEGIFEQVQATLARKLGSEVGVQAASVMFRDASGGGSGIGDGDQLMSSVPRSGSVSGKSSFSWRRLRSKNSSAALGSVYSGVGGIGAAKKESTTALGEGAGGQDVGPTVASLSMTSHPTSRPAKRVLAGVQFTGPNANYMAALARLFDAAQAIDQIARQVEDPGLRHADKTQVGLELCTRHAAEFFAFYICRFVLSDLTMLLDKFIKRGSEWVLV